MDYNNTDPDWLREVLVTQIETSQKTKNIENEQQNISERSQHQNLSRRAHQQRIEDDYHDAFKEEAENQRIYQAKVREDQLRAKDITRQRDKELTDIKMRQHLRENSIELRELESQLRRAYVTKELAAQLAEKEYLKMAEKKHERETAAKLQQALNLNVEAERQELEDEMKRKLQYKKELQDQMILNYQLKENMYEEFLKEKKYLDSIIQQIYDEDQREMEHKMCKMKRTKEEIESFKAAQAIWRDRERQELEEENQRIMAYIKKQDAKEREKELEKQRIAAQRVAQTDAMGKKIYAIEQERKEREELIQDLIEEELIELDNIKLKNDIKRQVQKRIEMQDILAIQMEERKQRHRQEELEDIQYKEQVLAKIAEDEKLEQMSGEKRRQKMMLMRREIEENLKDRRAKRAEELRQLLYLDEQEKIVAENKKKLIEEERLRMLKEHAVNLIGYLPPGVLRADDLPHLGSDVAEQYSAKS